MVVSIIELILWLGSSLLLVYYYLIKGLNFWEKRGILGPKPIPIFGNFKDVILAKVHQADYLKSIYDTFCYEPVVGLFMWRKPVLVVRNLDIIKDVLIKSFSNFEDRGIKIHEDIDPLAKHLVSLEPKRWKPLRRKLTPAFTSGKLKQMLYLINDCADHYEKYIQSVVDKGEPVECRELTAKYTTDVIGVCAFGLNMNALSNEESEFRKMGRLVFADSWYNRTRRLTRLLPHSVARFFKPIARDDKIINFFVTTLRETMEYRKINNLRSHDIVDVLIDIKDHPEQINDGEQITELFLTAQAFVFFTAGFETTSNTMSHAMYELALNPEIQDKLRQEVNATYAANNGKLTYDSIKEMKYMDKVFKETLRKYPPAFTLFRKSMSDHSFLGTKISISKGTNVMIPIYAIQHDPMYYPDPDKFDPERFDEEIANKRNPMTFLSFGDGPRNCIGERFAYNQFKVGLALTVRKFKLEVCEKTCKTYVKHTRLSTLLPSDGFYLRVKKI